MKNLQFLTILMENFAMFSKFIDFFREIFGKNLENLIIRCCANLLKSQSKNQWTPAVFVKFNGNFAIFPKSFRVLSIFGENLDKNFGHFETIHF